MVATQADNDHKNHKVSIYSPKTYTKVYILINDEYLKNQSYNCHAAGYAETSIK